MSSVLGYNRTTAGNTFLNEEILKDDNISYTVASSISRAVVDHLIYYLRYIFSDVVFQYSSTSGSTSVSILGKYPETYSNTKFPSIIVYVQNYKTDSIFIGDNSKRYGSEMIKAKSGLYEVIFDVWGRTQLEIEAVSGALIRILDDANHDHNFLKRGFTSTRYIGTLGREFDITDKIVQTVSHLDTSINVRREQVVFQFEFLYRINIPKVSTNNYITSPTFSLSVEQSDGNTFTVSISPSRKVYSQGMLISSG